MEALSPAPDKSEKLIVALDVGSADEANKVVEELRGRVGAFKVGLRLFTAAGPVFVRKLTESGSRVFLDLKFHDIPNTVAAAAVEAARLGVWMFNVHALGGSEMMLRTKDAVESECAHAGIESPLVIAVTVLTSANAGTLSEVGIDREPASEVVNLARLTAQCGLDGVVASAQEAEAIRDAIPESGFRIVTPGIRLIDGTTDDQRRVTTPAESVAAGATFIVVGRPILDAEDRVAAAEAIIAEL